MFARIYLYYLYICSNFNNRIYNIYYLYKYDTSKDIIKIKNITILYYILYFLRLNNNNRILKYLSIKRNNVIIKNKKNKFVKLDNTEFTPVVPNGIIGDIIINIENHRYETSNLKKNIFNIDKNISLIFCLAYFENIKKFNLCYLTLEYKKIFINNSNKSNIFKVHSNDIINNIFNLNK